MKKAFENYISMLDDSNLEDSIVKDLDILQLSTSEKSFNLATKLYIEKYSKVSNPNIKSFLSYFTKEWINHGLESINATIKKEATFRDRMPMADFIKTALILLKNGL